MTAGDLAAVAFVAVVLGASALGFAAHLCWLLMTDPRELCAAVAMFARVVTG